VDGLAQIEPAHAQRFYDEIGTQVTAAVYRAWTPMMNELGTELRAAIEPLQKRAAEISQRESAVQTHEAELAKRADGLHRAMIEHAASVSLGKAPGKA
jgi:hypothetical protein